MTMGSELIHNTTQRCLTCFIAPASGQKGSGLGLYILKRAVERLNGTAYEVSTTGAQKQSDLIIESFLSRIRGKSVSQSELRLAFRRLRGPFERPRIRGGTANAGSR